MECRISIGWFSYVFSCGEVEAYFTSSQAGGFFFIKWRTKKS